MILILLTDDDNNTCQVACPDVETARMVASAAVFSDGGVSAWRVPEMAVTDTDRVIEWLRRGENCADLLNARLARTYLDIREHEYTKCAHCHLFVEPNDEAWASTCRHCGLAITFDGTYWRDHDAPESDNYGTADCGYRPAGGGHEPLNPLALYLHLHRGDEADDELDASHEPQPSDQRHPLSWWREHGPEEMKARFTA